jgi:GMP synthase-like glutamine amidotransferase
VADPPWFVLQHVPYEGPGLIGAAAAAAGVDLRPRRLFDRNDAGADEVPPPDRADDLGGLVVMGGPMGAHDDAEHPHLADERLLIAAALKAGRPVLGVCLGAQLMAAALGARVLPGEAGQEIGLGAVDLTPEGRTDPVLGPVGRTLPVLHWHGDTYDLPPSAVRLAASARYPQQAFRVGERAYGRQFHVEVDEPGAAAMEPEFPPGVRLDRRHLALVQRAGKGVLSRFFAVATR